MRSPTVNGHPRQAEKTTKENEESIRKRTPGLVGVDSDQRQGSGVLCAAGHTEAHVEPGNLGALAAAFPGTDENRTRKPPAHHRSEAKAKGGGEHTVSSDSCMGSAHLPVPQLATSPS